MDSINVGGKGDALAPDRSWDEARNIFYQDLGQAKREKLDDTTRLEDTIASLKLAQSKVSKEYGTHILRVGSKRIDIRVGRILRRLELVLQVGDTAMQFAPETVSLVWSAFRMVFTGFLKDSQFCTDLFDAVDHISDILFVCQVYVKQYSKETAVSDDSKVVGDRVLKQIPPLYATVLKFSYQTRKLVIDHEKIGRSLRGVFSGEFEELKKTVDDAKEKRDNLQRMADVAFKVAALGLLTDLHEDSRALEDLINAVMIPDLKDIQSELAKGREHREKGDLEKSRQEQEKWLLSGDSADLQSPETQYSANIKHRHPGTCKWILKTPEYMNWRDQDTPSLLHLFGEGGYGKSYLVSTIVEDLRNNFPQQVESKPQLVYFFCKSGDNATQYGVKIMLHLVAQLFSNCADEAKERNDESLDQKQKYQALINVVKDARDKMKSAEGKKDSSLLQISSALLPMFTDLAREMETRVFVIVDGLDECCDLNAGFLDALKVLPNSGVDIRVLVSSRPEDLIVNELSEALYNKIEVNKETNRADLIAYIEESLKSMPRLRQLKVGPRIAKKSDGMFLYANMVIESLKQSKAVRTNAQQLMKHLPDGMNNLYKQKLQKLGADDREILLVALRWLMCSDGEIGLGLLADDIEHCYEDFGNDEDDSEYEDNEEPNDGSVDSGTSTSRETRKEGIDCNDRDSIKRLREVGRDFLKFSSTVVDVQHQSVRDFIHSEDKSLPRDPRICPECIERMVQDSVYQAAPKHGHLIMVENIFRKLISPSFQNEFIIIKGFERDKADTGSVGSSSRRRGSDTLPKDDVTNANVTLQKRLDMGDGSQSSEAAVHSDTETIELSTQIMMAAEDADAISDLPDGYPDYDPNREAPPRYELVQWPRHLQAAEEAWPIAERDIDSKERWDKLYTTVETFLSPESIVYKCWWRRSIRGKKKPFHPLHVVANFGLLGMMQRYISYGMNVDVLYEDDWTPLHFACGRFSNNIGIDFLVQHGAEVNALTRNKETPLWLLARSEGSPKMFQYLLDYGAKPEIPNSRGWTCLHHAAGSRNLDLCRILVGCSTVDINAKDCDGETPLHWMFRLPNASRELVKLFMDHGARVNEQNEKSEGPLFSACLVGNVPGAQLLLDYGADIDDDDDVFGRTALHAAVHASQLELVKLLVERGADLYRQDKKGRDCFAKAADEDEVGILEYLLDTWKPPDSVTRHLLVQDFDGNTPLHRSAAMGHEKAVEILLKAGDAAMLCSQVNHIGASPLHLAAKRGKFETVKILLENDGNPAGRTSQGSLPLDAAFQGWKDDYMSYSGDFSKICETLARISPDAAQKTDILDFAVEKGAVNLVEALTITNDSVDAHGWALEMLAHQYGHHQIANVLLQRVHSSTIEDSRSSRESALIHSPSRWSTIAKHPELILSEDGLEVACPTNSNGLKLFIAAQTDHPVRAGISEYYYEISILEAAVDPPSLGLGFSSKYATLDAMPGWPGNGAPTWGYHGDDGKKFTCVNFVEEYSVTYRPGDTVGCGVNFTAGTIFYTKNGTLLPTAFEDVRGRLFPTFGMSSDCGARILANFGQQKDVPFKYQP